jgi:hypothetical protein
MIAFKAVVIAGLVAVTGVYLTRGRSLWRDRFLVLFLFVCLVVAVVFPATTAVLADYVGVGRGVDLAFYVGFLLLFFLVGIQRARLRMQERTLSTIVRELAILRAKPPIDEQAAELGAADADSGGAGDARPPPQT